MSLPIFIVHRGNSDYLKYCLDQVKKYNPGSVIYLLGDESNSGYDFVSHQHVSDYSDTATEFESVYRHLNTVRSDFVLFCFKRWFFINEFLIKHSNINEFLYLDTDALLYSNVTQEFAKFSNFEVTICRE